MALTKIGTDSIKDDAVTTDKLANAINTERTANTAKTGLGTNAVQTAHIADEQITLAKLEHGTSSNDGKFLRANNGADPTFESLPASGISDIVSDTSPQLGGDLDSNGNNIKITDGEELRLGDGNDLVIKHDGSHSYINDNGSGNLYVSVSSKLHLQNQAQDESIAVFNENGSCDLYHDNSKKLETTSTGINVTGGIRVGGNNAANELDDYEEGTFSSLHFLNGWGYTGDGSNANNGPVTGSHSTGRYTKIGDIVYIHFRVNVGSVSYTNANQIHMGYPPFYADDTYDRQELGFYVHTCASSGQELFMTTKATSKYYFGFHQRGNTGTSNFTGSNGGSSFDITVNGFYRVE